MFTNRKNITNTFAVWLLVFTCAGSAFAATGDWQKEVDRSAAAIAAGEYDHSLKIVDRLVSDMVERLGAGAVEEEAFATVLTHKALANAGLGNVDDALWYWYIAQQIHPPIARNEMVAFGAPGEFLKRHALSSADAIVPGGAVPLRVLKQVMPKFPAGASRFGIAGDLVVQVIIDKNGLPTLPRIVRGLPAPTLSFVALEALKRWRFQPATRNGQPVSAAFDLQVHYKL